MLYLQLSLSSLLYGLAQFLFDHLQNVHNSTARLKTESEKSDHTTPIALASCQTKARVYTAVINI